MKEGVSPSTDTLSKEFSSTEKFPLKEDMFLHLGVLFDGHVLVIINRPTSHVVHLTVTRPFDSLISTGHQENIMDYLQALSSHPTMPSTLPSWR